MNFSKTFLAGLLAFIVGNILIAVLWSLFVMGMGRCWWCSWMGLRLNVEVKKNNRIH